MTTLIATIIGVVVAIVLLYVVWRLVIRPWIETPDDVDEMEELTRDEDEE